MSGCLASASEKLPSPPPVPDGWVTVEKAGLRIALPPQWEPAEGWDDLAMSFGVGDPNVFLLAQAPVRVETPPETDSSAQVIADWLLSRVSTTRPASFSSSEVRLPAGPAVAVRFHFEGEAGSFEAVEGVAYAIRTSDGTAYLQINMSESLLAEFGDAMAEVPRHLSLANEQD
jgi:hypothetical protein